MDVVGGVIVAADHKDRAAAVCSGRRMKRGRCGEVSYDGAMAMVKKKTTVTTTTTTTKKSLLPCVEEDVDYLHEDYELRSVLSLYRPAIVKPARSWVDPLRFLLKKELTTTDVGDLGRIILPKVSSFFLSGILVLCEGGFESCCALLYYSVQVRAHIS